MVIGAGDCPHCGGDVVFDLHGSDSEVRAEGPGAEGPLRRLLRRLRRR